MSSNVCSTDEYRVHFWTRYSPIASPAAHSCRRSSVAPSKSKGITQSDVGVSSNGVSTRHTRTSENYSFAGIASIVPRLYTYSIGHKFATAFGQCTAWNQWYLTKQGTAVGRCLLGLAGAAGRYSSLLIVCRWRRNS